MRAAHFAEIVIPGNDPYAACPASSLATANTHFLDVAALKRTQGFFSGRALERDILPLNRNQADAAFDLTLHSGPPESFDCIVDSLKSFVKFKNDFF
jgi:hypothetical protein